MKSNIFIIISSLTDESPVKASISLANNADSNYFDVYIVIFKKNLTLLNRINKNIRVINLSNLPFIFKYYKLKILLKKISGVKISIAYGFFGDFINYFFKRNFSYTISNIRGTLFELYELKYGNIFGKIFLFLHNYLLQNIDYILVLNFKIKSYYSTHNIGKKQLVFNNFIDDDKYFNISKCNVKDDFIKLVYLGNLSKEKGIFTLINILNKLNNENLNFFIYIIGKSENDISFNNFLKNNLPEENFEFLGYLKDPFNYFAKCDYLIHPSYSEGTPRAALESLYYDTPVIIRESVSNGLITNNINGFEFKDDLHLYFLLKNIFTNKIILSGKNLTPYVFTKEYNINEINNFLKQLK